MCVRGFLKYSELKEIVVIVSDCIYNSDFILCFPGDDEILQRIFDKKDDSEWKVTLLSESDFLASIDSLQYSKNSVFRLKEIETMADPSLHTGHDNSILYEESERICI